MRIAIDARAYSWAGIGRYIRNLVRHLLEQDSGNFYAILVSKEDLKKVEEDLADVGSGRNWQLHEVTGDYYSLAEQTTFRWQLQQVRADLFHFTHFNAPVFFNKPYVVTIHDITRFIFPGQKQQSLLQQIAYEFVFSQVVAGARSVITVSNSTKNELENLPIKLPKNIQVIYEAADEQFINSVTADQKQKAQMLLGLKEKYFLYVGVWMSHKNIKRMLEAFASFSAKFPDIKLVMTGKPRPGYSKVLKLVENLKLENKVVFAGFIPTQLMPAVYVGAQALLFPSLYEGFGLPALEAAALGTPVVTSNVSSLPEIMNKAALYVNPEHTPDIIRAMEKVIRDKGLIRNLAVSGQRRAREFSWEQTATEHLRVYETVVGNNP